MTFFWSGSVKKNTTENEHTKKFFFVLVRKGQKEAMFLHPKIITSSVPQKILDKSNFVTSIIENDNFFLQM